ncbi:hypothetical protein [Hahella sp. NBU794]|uniref:hypothetical protein n=1 Tax=Hahella sp. NBU794 TaxID=3422590 RepID=UPI003D6F4C96
MNLLALKLRHLHEPCIPAGPDFSQAQRLEVSLSGSMLSMLAPKHQPAKSVDKEIRLSSNLNLHDESIYKTDLHGGCDYFLAMKRFSRFRGPIFTGYVAQLGITLLLEKILPSRPNFSLFHAGDLEGTVMSLLTQEYGSESSNGRSSYDAPVNWSIKGDFPVPCATYEVLTAPNRSGLRKKSMVFPVEHGVLATISFHFQQFAIGTLADQDKLINPQPLYELAQNIIDSVQLQLSPNILNEYQEIRSQHPDVALSEELKPLKWTSPEQDKEWDEYSAELAEQRSASEFSKRHS